MFPFQEASYAKLGILPALCLYNATQRIDLPEVRKMVKRAKSLGTTKLPDRRRS
jgi:hypothetical protein